MATTPFLKMHGLGNDFVVLDARTAALDLTPERRRVIADRRLGVGCDQLIVLEPPTEREADVFMRIYNPDGGEAQACGNATRCVASVVMDERKTDLVTVQTVAGLLELQKTGVGSNGLPVIGALFSTSVFSQNLQPNPAGSDARITLSGIDGTASYSETVCPGFNLCFDIFAFGGNQQKAEMYWDAGIPNAAFIVSNADMPTGHFCWTPSVADARRTPYTFM